MRTGRFYLKYDPNSKLGWTKRAIGKTFFQKLPSVVAAKLNLPNPTAYTGHSLRATSATILADEGASLTTLKRHCDWDSDQVAEGYIRESKKHKVDVSNTIIGSPNLSTEEVKFAAASGITFYNCSIGNIHL